MSALDLWTKMASMSRAGRARRLALIPCLLLVSLGAAATASAAPPSSVSSTATSPLASCTADQAGSQPGINFPNSEVEPWVAVDPRDREHVVAVWQQDRWSNGGSRGNVVAHSFDGGARWTVVTATKSSLCTGGTSGNGGRYQRASDPWLSFAPNGHLYLMSLSGDRAPEAVPFNLNPDAMLVSKSTDGGRTWSDPATLIRDENPDVLNDKNSLTADPNDARFVYAVWDRLEDLGDGYRGPSWFARTTDGGATWEPARSIYDPGVNAQTLGNQIAVLPDSRGFNGALVNLITLIRDEMPGDDRVQVAVIRSSDRGTTWSGPVIIDRLLAQVVTDPLTRRVVRAGDILSDIAVDGASGAIYVVWHDERFSRGQHNDVALSMSTDGGLSWSAPVKVNQTPAVPEAGNRQAFTPSVDVAGNGAVAVSYYDFRNNRVDTASNSPLETDRFLAQCRRPSRSQPDRCADPGGWSESRLTPASFDLRQAPNARGLFLGDYMALDHAGTGFVSLFVQAGSSTDPATVYHSLSEQRPVPHVRSVSLRLSRHLLAAGRVAANDRYTRCTSRVPVTIERRTPPGWSRVGEVRTGADGSFRTRLRDRQGDYRATLPRVSLGSEHVCLRAQSPTRSHRH